MTSRNWKSAFRRKVGGYMVDQLSKQVDKKNEIIAALKASNFAQEAQVKRIGYKLSTTIGENIECKKQIAELRNTVERQRTELHKADELNNKLLSENKRLYQDNCKIYRDNNKLYNDNSALYNDNTTLIKKVKDLNELSNNQSLADAIIEEFEEEDNNETTTQE